MTAVKFGICLPTFQGASARPHDIGFESIRDYTVKADQLGYHSLWAADHLVLGGEGGMHEVWTTLSALALVTEKIRLGTLVLCNTHRNPALTAKMAATLDNISGGRVDLGVGAGWYRTEQISYGLPWVESGATRIEMLRESIEVMRQMFRGGPVSFDGEHYQLDDAICYPLPVQRPNPPIWIGGAGERLMLRLVAEEADGWNVPSLPLEDYAGKLSVIRRHCEEAGTDYDAIEKSMETRCMIFQHPEDMDAVVDWYLGFQEDVEEAGELQPRSQAAEELREQYILGDLDEVRERIRQYVEIGVQHFMFYFLDYPSHYSLETFATEVMPEFG